MRYARSADAYAEAAIKTDNSLAWLNIAQAFITNALMAGAMAFIGHCYPVWLRFAGGKGVARIVSGEAAIEGARGDIVNERNKTYPDRALAALVGS